MAYSTKSDEVRIVVVALLAAQLFVMDLQVLSGAADLASPAVATQYLFSQLIVKLGI